MSFLGIKTINPWPDGFDAWAFSHAQHHNDLTESLGSTVNFTGNVTSGSPQITGVSSVLGLFPGQNIFGTGIPGGALITNVDTIANGVTINQNATASATAEALSASFPRLPAFILDPVDLNHIDQFLQDHQLSHNAINGVLNTAGNDLQDINFTNENEVRAWLDLNFTEHQAWVSVTGVE